MARCTSSTAAKEKGIKPILGCELYICKEDDHRAKPNPDLKYNHLLVLAENEEGYRNLVRLTSRGRAAWLLSQAARLARIFWRNIRRG